MVGDALLREDQRLPNQLRALAAEPGALSRANGSARFSHDGTQVLAAVWGPGEVRRARERPDRATLEVVVRPHAGLAGPLERELEQLLLSTLAHVVLLALHPRTLISVVIQPLMDDGALLAVRRCERAGRLEKRRALQHHHPHACRLRCMPAAWR